MQLYKYQEEAVQNLSAQRHILIAKTGHGKGYISLAWARKTRRSNIIVVTQASKRTSKDFETEADTLDHEWYSSLSSFVVLSWNGLAKWYAEHRSTDFGDYAFVFDEIHRAKAGVSSGMGKAFLDITRKTTCWSGYTATPGDKWIDFYPYFVASRYILNKTLFMKRFCNVQTYKGYPEIIGYNEMDVLKRWWGEITYFPNTDDIEKQLPPASHKVIKFDKPKGYNKVISTRKRLDNDEFIETTMGLCHYLRQLSATPEKMQWISDFIEGLGERCIIFYNYIEEGERIAEVLKKALPKSAKVWIINGKSHDIPTKDTMGERDVVLAQWTSGSASLNFQFINYWVSFTPCYSLTVSVQGRGRIRRIGQQKPQFFYYLQCTDSIEEDIYECLHEKKDFSEVTWVAQKLKDVV